MPHPSEREKMLTGQLYNPNDPQLIKDRQRAWRLLHAYGQTFAPIPEWRLAAMRFAEHFGYRTPERQKEILSKLLGAVGEGVAIAPGFCCDYGYQIRVGRGSFFNHGAIILDCGLVSIGEYVFFGPGVHVYAVNHPLDPITRRTPSNVHGLPVTIGNDVWVGGGAKIMPGVTIGEGSIIGANAVVTKDVPAGVIVVGTPARFMRNVGSSDREKFGTQASGS